MWTDNETNRDFLNFRCVADIAAETIIQAAGQPLSMGVSGGWGVGKSSMLKLISDALNERGDDRYLFVEFNAWLYQGYDDARAALMEVIARRLIEHGEETTKTGLDKARDLLSRVNWLRLAGMATGSALSLAVGIPPLWLAGPAFAAGKSLVTGEGNQQDVDTVYQSGKAVAEEAGKLVTPGPESSPPRQIQDLRKQFEETLREMDVTLVVFIDDLDRCLPATAIATLEAIRLFLFLPQTAFIIAADDRMIRQAVRIHFRGEDLDETLVTNYFDKLVQIPLRVPPLGTQEVRAYLMLLFIENSDMKEDECERLRQEICDRLSESWKGHRVDLRFVLDRIGDCGETLRVNLELADRLAPLMTTARQIAGNPRLIKRFLNTLAIRMSIARVQHVAVDEGALAKMLLFERCANEGAYADLINSINNNEEGRPTILADWEKKARAGEDIDELPPAWKSPFTTDWLALPPTFAEMDLRSAVYVSREHMPIVTSADYLSFEASEILEALLALEGSESSQLADQLRSLPGREITLIVERLMARARQEQEWGTPSVLWALLTVIAADKEQAQPFARFLERIPREFLQPDIVPVLNGREWASDALTAWGLGDDTPRPVRAALRAMEKRII